MTKVRKTESLLKGQKVKEQKIRDTSSTIFFQRVKDFPPSKLFSTLFSYYVLSFGLLYVSKNGVCSSNKCCISAFQTSLFTNGKKVLAFIETKKKNWLWQKWRRSWWPRTVCRTRRIRISSTITAKGDNGPNSRVLSSGSTPKSPPFIKEPLKERPIFFWDLCLRARSRFTRNEESSYGWGAEWREKKNCQRISNEVRLAWKSQIEENESWLMEAVPFRKGVEALGTF